MCGITGIIDLNGIKKFPSGKIMTMASAIEHRGPDEFGILNVPGVALASRRLSIVDLESGKQPIYNEDQSIAVLYNGELFDYIEKRDFLIKKGHTFRTHCDTEIIVHLWEEYGEEMFDHLKGQFAFVLCDLKKNLIIMARDRVGICPLHWAHRKDNIYIGSEIKAILASKEVDPEPDPKGIDHIFTFFAMPSRRTAFKNISAVHPGSYIKSFKRQI